MVSMGTHKPAYPTYSDSQCASAFTAYWIPVQVRVTHGVTVLVLLNTAYDLRYTTGKLLASRVSCFHHDVTSMGMYACTVCPSGRFAALLACFGVSGPVTSARLHAPAHSAPGSAFGSVQENPAGTVIFI